MKKFVLGVIILLVISILVGAIWKEKSSSVYHFAARDSHADSLREQISSAIMVDYYDKTFDVRIAYPDIFTEFDTLEAGTARFFYPSKESKEISLFMFVEPNVEKWSIKDAIFNISDSTTECLMEGENFYILTGELGNSPHVMYIEKCYLVGNNWIDLTLYYIPKYKDAVERIVELVKNWNPYPYLFRDNSCNKVLSQLEEDPFPVYYGNELFSINLPKGWVWDDSDWNGLDSLVNEVDFYNPDDGTVWFHCVKTFLPIKWKNVKEATDMARCARLSNGKGITLIDEIDGIEVGGYPTSIMLFENIQDNDTVMQKQYITYLQDSHIVIYFNANYYARNSLPAQKIAADIIKNIKLRKVINPLENDDKLKKVIEKTAGIVMKDGDVENVHYNKIKEHIKKMKEKGVIR